MQRVVISDDQLRAVVRAVQSKRWALEDSVNTENPERQTLHGLEDTLGAICGTADSYVISPRTE